MSEVLKQLTSHAGWQEFTKLLKEEIKAEKIDVSLSAEEIGKRYLAVTMASDILDRTISKAENQGVSIKDRIKYT
jgi:hypothetical protein